MSRPLNWRRYLVNGLLGVVSLLVALWLGEQWLALRQAMDPTTEHREMDRKLRLRSHRLAKQHPHGFTDVVRSKDKPEGVYRIAVLGDSFIWGSGLPYEQVWSHRLEALLTARHSQIEVMSWGRNGWSTLDELVFLKEHGRHYEVDLLVVGLVENDPDAGLVPRINADGRKLWIEQNLGFALRWYPRFTRLVGERLLDAQLGTIHEEYRHWLGAIYAPENLEVYGQILKDLRVTTETLGMELLVVMTPGSRLGERTERAFETLTPMMADAGIETLNLFPGARDRFRGYPTEQLRANPVNGHPGPLMTEFFAEQVAQRLEETLRDHGEHSP
ncbi:hypothetical protein MK489_11840 [Myxococcota bacterium]|nr:hypothetical protein [Myxococcota bacterium]